jgi:hypothetical protein
MYKKLILAGTLLASVQVVAAPDAWTKYNCSQLCGNETVVFNVVFESTDLGATKAALGDFCNNNYGNDYSFRDGDTPRCTEESFDYTEDKEYQDCNNGGKKSGACGVEVVGYDIRLGQYSRKYFNARSATSFYDAERDAIRKCQQSYDVYSARCTIRSWYTTKE